MYLGLLSLRRPQLRKFINQLRNIIRSKFHMFNNLSGGCVLFFFGFCFLRDLISLLLKLQFQLSFRLFSYDTPKLSSC